jgi:hypothetical protein
VSKRRNIFFFFFWGGGVFAIWIKLHILQPYYVVYLRPIIPISPSAGCMAKQKPIISCTKTAKILDPAPPIPIDFIMNF